MKIYVYVLEASNLSSQDTYVKLRLGKFKSKTRVLKNTKNPVWNEEFAFRVHDLEQELVISVCEHGEGSGLFSGSDLLGRVRIRVGSIAAEGDQILHPTWFPLEKHRASKSNTNKDYGKILLALSLHGKNLEVPNEHALHEPSKFKENEDHETISPEIPHPRKSLEGKHMMKAIAGRLEKLFSKNEETIRNSDDSSDRSTTISDYEDYLEEPQISSNFEEDMEKLKSLSCNREMSANLPGGVLLDQAYKSSPKDLNLFLFAPNSQFRKDLAELQGTTGIQEGSWLWKSDDDVACLTRVVSYIKAATKLVKAVKATEEQTYTKGDGREFAIFVSVNTPDVPYGSTFKVELLYAITPGDEETSRLVISWGINFSQSTMMRGMIEKGAQQGLKESFDQFSSLLAQNIKTIDSVDVLDKDHMLANLHNENQSDWKSAIGYFCNLTVICAIFVSIYVFVHILKCKPGEIQGLEFNGLDLPDSVGEVITGGILVLLLERVFKMVSHFVQAKFQKGSDRGIKAQGEGWVLTVALIDGENLVSLDPTSLPDPYVVLTCNGKTRTSSVKLQTLDPTWNEILEFDASEEPPAVLDVEVLDFDGPFEQSASLGHAEINFLKHTSVELADIWVPLEGKLAQSSQSKLHLRIFLDNNNGVETIREYLLKMEKEVGKKLNLQSPHRNSTFQKIFGLPPDEFLISDFMCSLKRKMPLRGHLYISARIVGFYSNLFGHKTKFYFLLEDIDEIQELSPSLSSVGSPQLVIILRQGRGLDAKHGAKFQDDEGRLHFYFISFISFTAATRIVTALWRTRTLTPYQRAQIAEEQMEEEEEDEDEGESSSLEESNSCLVIDDINMAKVYSAELPIKVNSIMEMFEGGNLENEVMGKAGCLSYVTSKWELVKPDVFERRLFYKFNRHFSIFGGEVTCTQQKFPICNGRGWILNEVMALHDIPFCDHFRVYFKSQFEESAHAPSFCKCNAYVGVTWLRSTKFQHRITRNVIEKLTSRLKHIFELVEKEILLTNGPT